MCMQDCSSSSVIDESHQLAECECDSNVQGTCEVAKKAKLQSCCKELVFKQHSSKVSLVDCDHTQSKSLFESEHTTNTSLIESDHTEKCSTVSYCVSNRYFRE